jgi:hypothetical protein
MLVVTFDDNGHHDDDDRETLNTRHERERLILGDLEWKQFM